MNCQHFISLNCLRVSLAIDFWKTLDQPLYSLENLLTRLYNMPAVSLVDIKRINSTYCNSIFD